MVRTLAIIVLFVVTTTQVACAPKDRRYGDSTRHSVNCQRPKRTCGHSVGDKQRDFLVETIRKLQQQGLKVSSFCMDPCGDRIRYANEELRIYCETHGVCSALVGKGSCKGQ